MSRGDFINFDLLENNSDYNDISNPLIFKFKTNAKSFKINFTISNKVVGNYPHVGVSLREGLTIMYRKPGDKTWLYVDLVTQRFSPEIYMTHYIKEDIIYEVLIYGPILTKLSSLSVEINDEYLIENSPFDFNQKIIVAGGLNSFGIGCTSAGYMFSNILSRKLNADISHLTYNEVNYLDNIYEDIKNLDYKNPYDIGILELDYIDQDDDNVERYLEDVVDALSSKCKIVIGWFSIPIKEYKKNNIYQILKYNLDNKNLFITNIDSIYGELNDICTYSNRFINDSANVVIYENLMKIIMELTKWNI